MTRYTHNFAIEAMASQLRRMLGGEPDGQWITACARVAWSEVLRSGSLTMPTDPKELKHFLNRLKDAFPAGDVLIEYNGVMMRVRDTPDRFVRAMMGYGHHPEGRPIINVPGRVWETTPEQCTYGSLNWEWVTIRTDSGTDDIIPRHVQAHYLVCPKCGLDGT